LGSDELAQFPFGQALPSLEPTLVQLPVTPVPPDDPPLLGEVEAGAAEGEGAAGVEVDWAAA